MLDHRADVGSAAGGKKIGIKHDTDDAAAVGNRHDLVVIEIAIMIAQCSHPGMGRDDRIFGCGKNILNRLDPDMWNIDDHAERIQGADHLSAEIRESSRGRAGILGWGCPIQAVIPGNG